MRLMRVLIVCGFVVGFSGCAAVPFLERPGYANATDCHAFRNVYPGEQKAAVRQFTRELTLGVSGRGERAEDLEDRFNAFLDCYFVALKDGSSDEMHHLRGHAVIAVLARYAAFNVTGQIGGGLHTTSFGSYDELASDAAGILSRIENAERILRLESPHAPQFPEDVRPQVEKTALALSHFRDVKRMNRVFSILQVAFEAERPTTRRGSRFAKNLAALVSGSPVSVDAVVKTAIRGLEKAAILNIYSDAYRSDLEKLFKAANTPPQAPDWEKIDAVIREACDRLSVAAGGIVPRCVPASGP